MSALFFDEVCPKPYDKNVLATEPLGGTEATVTRVSEALSSVMPCYVNLHNKDDDFSVFSHKNPDNVICLRNPNSLLTARENCEKAKLYLWCHDLPTSDLGRSIDIIRQTGADLVCVSKWHKATTTELLTHFGYRGEFKIHYIYNPIDDALVPNNEPYDKNKLVFFSSPHKGLKRTIFLFECLLGFNKDFKLYIANPGYIPSNERLHPNIVPLGSISHSEAISHVRQSLCTLYANTVFPETFGLVFAESDAVGTPVLTHRLGSASEILDHPAELVNCNDAKSVIERVMSWHAGERPKVQARPQFRLSRVIKEWERLLNGG